MASMDRRNFLLNTLAGARPFVSGKNSLRVGIIGCGRMGQYYATAYKALPETEIVAIAEWNAERRKVVGER
jgi:predicted homoserine dehydrogenase-like protein